MRPVVTILGGSTPFTAALVEALRSAAGELPACELRLFGQDGAALERMRRYASARLAAAGWVASATARLDDAVEGAGVVVNQIRFGGLSGRARDEALANRFQLPADETLGPCGLNAALRIVPRIRELAASLGELCPDAWVLNLANPLSITTAAMIAAGAPARCVGLCELPLATVREACGVLRIPFAEVEWDYVGLNHRGFVCSLRHQGEDLMPRLPALLGGETISGVSADEIRAVGALPLKYFRLSTSSTKAAPCHRAGFLEDLRETLARELESSSAPPKALSGRKLDWYEGAVVPMIAAIFAGDRRQVVVNSLGGDGLVREAPAWISRDRFEVLAAPRPPLVGPWLDRWQAHEQAMLGAITSPSLERIEHALALDPAVPQALTGEIARAIWAEHAN